MQKMRIPFLSQQSVYSANSANVNSIVGISESLGGLWRLVGISVVTLTRIESLVSHSNAPHCQFHLHKSAVSRSLTFHNQGFRLKPNSEITWQPGE